LFSAGRRSTKREDYAVRNAHDAARRRIAGASQEGWGRPEIGQAIRAARESSHRLRPHAPDLAVITVSTNDARWLTPCLRPLYAHAGTARLDVVVVDNNPADGTRALVEEHVPQARCRTGWPSWPPSRRGTRSGRVWPAAERSAPCAGPRRAAALRMLAGRSEPPFRVPPRTAIDSTQAAAAVRHPSSAVSSTHPRHLRAA
jgi:hypothetical protein